MYILLGFFYIIIILLFYYYYLFKSSIMIHLIYFAAIVAGQGDLNTIPDRHLVVGSSFVHNLTIYHVK